MGKNWDSYYPYYPPANPKKVKDGVKLTSGKIGATWWSQKWITLLGGFGWSNRLARGRSYARSGQVVNFILEVGKVNANVQGTAAKPYGVIIRIPKFSEIEWQKAIKIMSSQAVFATKLLSGQMPPDIEKVFSDSGISLFPEKAKDFQAECSCPDWANPCKHIAAVHYVLADEFDRDPFMIFRLRGRNKKEIIDEISKQWAKSPVPKEVQLKTTRLMPKTPKVEPLEKTRRRFWKSPDKGEIFTVAIQPPDVALSLIRRLGPPPFWHGSPDFRKEMEKIYKTVTKRAIEKAYLEK